MSEVTAGQELHGRVATWPHIRCMEVLWLQYRRLKSSRYKDIPRCTELKDSGSIPAASNRCARFSDGSLNSPGVVTDEIETACIGHGCWFNCGYRQIQKLPTPKG